MTSTSPFNKDILKGKVALITGGGTGINFGIAKIFAQHGASLALMGRRKEILQDAANKLTQLGVSVAVVSGDVSSEIAANEAVAKTVEKFGRIDILVNGAAGNFLCSAEELSLNAFKRVIEIDLIGTFNLSRAAFPYLKKVKGIILNISATLQYRATKWQSHAISAKSGIDGLTTSLAGEWGEFGIRVNGIAPGPIKDTEAMVRLFPGVSSELKEQILSESIPLGRMGTVEDVGYAALFLCSSGGSWITGNTLVVDGGEWFGQKPFISRESLELIQQQRKQKSKL